MILIFDIGITMSARPVARSIFDVREADNRLDKQNCERCGARALVVNYY